MQVDRARRSEIFTVNAGRHVANSPWMETLTHYHARIGWHRREAPQV
jgi:hypothetical protein